MHALGKGGALRDRRMSSQEKITVKRSMKHCSLLASVQVARKFGDLCGCGAFCQMRKEQMMHQGERIKKPGAMPRHKCIRHARFFSGMAQVQSRFYTFGERPSGLGAELGSCWGA